MIRESLKEFLNVKIPAMVLVSLILLATPAISAPTTEVNLGGMIFSVSESSTAQVFHIVDQLSQWDQYAHKQYGRWAAKNLHLDQEDKQLLQKHADLRRARGWGNGFERAFLVDDSIDVAAVKAVQNKLLSPAEAATEKNILRHFASKLSGLFERSEVQMAAFRKRLTAEAEKIKPLVRRLLHFAEAREAQ